MVCLERGRVAVRSVITLRCLPKRDSVAFSRLVHFIAGFITGIIALFSYWLWCAEVAETSSRSYGEF